MRLPVPAATCCCRRCCRWAQIETLRDKLLSFNLIKRTICLLISLLFLLHGSPLPAPFLAGGFYPSMRHQVVGVARNTLPKMQDITNLRREWKVNEIKSSFKSLYWRKSSPLGEILKCPPVGATCFELCNYHDGIAIGYPSTRLSAVLFLVELFADVTWFRIW